MVRVRSYFLSEGYASSYVGGRSDIVTGETPGTLRSFKEEKEDRKKKRIWGVSLPLTGSSS